MKLSHWMLAGIAAFLLGLSQQALAQPQIVSGDDDKVSKADGKIAKNSAKFYISQKMYDEALDKLSVAVRGLPEDAEVHFMIGQLQNEKLRDAMRKGGQDQEERIRKMNEHFDSCLTLKNGQKKFGKKIQQMRDFWWTEYYNMGIAAFNAGDHGEALNGFQRSALVIPDKGLSYKMLGSTYQAMRQNEAAIEAYRKSIAMDASDATSFANLAIALINTGKADSAIIYLEKAHELKPDDQQILQNMSMVQLQTGDTEGALKTAEKALESDPDNVNALRTAAQIYLVARDYEKAAGLYERALEQAPGDPGISGNLAAAYVSMGESQKARALYEAEVERSPDSVEAWYQLGQIYRTDSETVDKAIEAFNKVVELQPTDDQAWLALSLVYMTKANNLEGAAAREAMKKGEEANKMAESLASGQE